jgi:hypothetical protein
MLEMKEMATIKTADAGGSLPGDFFGRTGPDLAKLSQPNGRSAPQENLNG